MSLFTGGLTLLAALPLFSVLGLLLWRGGKRLSLELFTRRLPPAAFAVGGGFGNAILGTLVMVGIAALIAIPFGVLAAVFLAEFSPESKTASAVRFCAKLLTGLPSILAGVFAYAAVVLATGTFSAPAGGVALAHADAADRDAHGRRSHSHGASANERGRHRHGLHADAGSVARDAADGGARHSDRRHAGGRSGGRRNGPAHLYCAVQQQLADEPTPGRNAFFPPASSLSRVTDSLMEPTASLAVLIYNFAGMPSENQIELAWAASLVLVLLVLMLNILGQTISSRAKKG